MRGKQILKKLLVSLLSFVLIFSMMPKEAHAGNATLPTPTITSASYDASSQTLTANFTWSSTKPLSMIELTMLSPTPGPSTGIGTLTFGDKSHPIIGIASTDGNYSGTIQKNGSDFTVSNTMYFADNTPPSSGESFLVSLNLESIDYSDPQNPVFDSSDFANPVVLVVGDPSTPLTPPACTHPESKREYTQDNAYTHTYTCSCGLDTIHIEGHDFKSEQVYMVSPEFPFGYTLETCNKCGYSQKTAYNPHLEDASVSFTGGVSEFTYTGSEIKPEINVTVKDITEANNITVPKENYTVTYKNNIEIGKGEIVIIGDEVKVKGKKTVEFDIVEESGSKPEPGAHEHTYGNIKVLLAATCTDGAYIEFECTECHEKFTANFNINEDKEKYPDLFKEYGAKGHDFTGPIKYFIRGTVKSEDEGQHGPTCTRCGLVDDKNLQPHSFTLHTVQNGVCGDPDQPIIIEGECACGAKLHAESSREHQWVADNSKDIQPTCTEPGKINGERCMFCGIFGNYDFVEALGHDIEIDERLEPTCQTDGFEDSHCKRCNEPFHKDLACLSPTRDHVFEPVQGKEPTCEEWGTYGGEKCKYCPEERAGETGYGIIPALGHKRNTASVTKLGRTRQKPDQNGKEMEITAYCAIYDCERCHKILGASYYTVATQVGRFPMYKIVSGKNAEINDMKNGVHVKNNMLDDGGVYFNGQVTKSLNDAIEKGEIQEYKKYETHSYVVEFTDAFLAKQANGWYDLMIINGDEILPLKVQVTDHKFTDLAEAEIANFDTAPEMSEAAFDAMLKNLDEFCAKINSGELVFTGNSVNRLFDPKTGRHLFTSEIGEYTNLLMNGWKAEGTAFTVGKTGAPVFRLYNAETTDHFYTADVKERDALAGNGWTVEGIAFTVDSSFKKPVYRLVNPKVKKGAYLLTADKSEADKLVAEGWTNEGVAFMVR